MREIRFRYWDGADMLYPPEDMREWDFNDIKYVAECHERGYPVMQYTGLKDKNGTEIYEGDIVDFDATEIGGDKFSGEILFTTDITLLSHPGFAIWANGIAPMGLGLYEVIGNIHENPELLDGGCG